jgi:hypothetical protein
MALKGLTAQLSQFTIPTGSDMAPTQTDSDDGGSMYLQNISIIVHIQQLITMEALLSYLHQFSLPLPQVTDSQL